MTRRASPECASDLRLERWLTGELGAEDGAKLDAHLAQCDSCRARHAQLVAEHRALSSELPPLPSMPSTGVVSALRPRRRMTHSVLGLGSLAAAFALWISLDGHPTAPVTRTKGSGDAVQLDWVIRRDGAVFAPDADEPLRPGDALRFGLRTKQRGQAAVLGLDGQGNAGIYHEWVPIEAGERQLLPGAFELDDVVGEEHLYGVVCEQISPLTSLQDAIRRSPSEPELPGGCAFDHHVVRKEPP
jgi:putative zinc finger protein